MEKKHRVYDPESERLLEMTIQDDGRITKIEEVRGEVETNILGHKNR